MKYAFSFFLIIGFLSTGAQARETASLRPGLIGPGGLPLFFSSEGPLAYSSMTPRQLPKNVMAIGEVSAESCQYSLSIPITATWRATSISGTIGNGTYEKIIETMERDHPGLLGIYNAKVDLHETTILGVFERFCTEVKAEGYR